MPNMTLKINSQNWPEYRDYFLLIHPNQTIPTEEDLILHPSLADKQLSDDDWVFHRIFLFAKGAYEKGVRHVFDQQAAPPINGAIISFST